MADIIPLIGVVATMAGLLCFGLGAKPSLASPGSACGLVTETAQTGALVARSGHAVVGTSRVCCAGGLDRAVWGTSHARHWNAEMTPVGREARELRWVAHMKHAGRCMRHGSLAGCMVVHCQHESVCAGCAQEVLGRRLEAHGAPAPACTTVAGGSDNTGCENKTLRSSIV
ncbi:RING/U-box superfamily protein [Striga asiatica]|uniref:RING/U-box superfamily protein n=1 Tax=Striga asiatica TaxID=4170 RepID=A0A5A7NXK8_STRAF|nr:RING/U-box superfamily protein [Striga asiatica]